jgi:hypothetical protein
MDCELQRWTGLETMLEVAPGAKRMRPYTVVRMQKFNA